MQHRESQLAKLLADAQEFLQKYGINLNVLWESECAIQLMNKAYDELAAKVEQQARLAPPSLKNQAQVMVDHLKKAELREAFFKDIRQTVEVNIYQNCKALHAPNHIFTPAGLKDAFAFKAEDFIGISEEPEKRTPKVQAILRSLDNVCQCMKDEQYFRFIVRLYEGCPLEWIPDEVRKWLFSQNRTFAIVGIIKNNGNSGGAGIPS